MKNTVKTGRCHVNSKVDSGNVVGDTGPISQAFVLLCVYTC